MRLLRLCIASLACLLCMAAQAQGTYPARPVRLVLPFPPGGSTDVLARLLSQKMSENWGKAVVVDNRPGAGGAIAAEAVAKSPNDGYTLFLGTLGDMAVNPSLYAKLPYDPEKDFTPVGLLAVTPLLLITHPSLPVRSVRELVDLAKAKPGSLSYLSVGEGSTQHLAGEMFKRAAGIDIVHVPFKGGAPQVTALLAAQDPQFGFVVMGTVVPHVQTGKLRAIAISTGKRSRVFADVPTMQETGFPTVDISPWYGIFAPAGTPKEIVNAVNAENARILKLPDVASKLSDLGFEITPSSPDELGHYLSAEIPKYRRVVKEGGIKTN